MPASDLTQSCQSLCMKTFKLAFHTGVQKSYFNNEFLDSIIRLRRELSGLTENGYNHVAYKEDR